MDLTNHPGANMENLTHRELCVLMVALESHRNSIKSCGVPMNDYVAECERILATVRMAITNKSEVVS